jgi:hypothetical protein
MKQKLIKFCAPIMIFLAILSVTGCANLSQPKHPKNLGSIFAERQSWYYQARKASKKWDVPISAMMAIMYQESSYRYNAQPPREWFLFIPLPRKSSAYGYAQAQNGTWDRYVKEAGGIFSSRSNFADSIDFIGWYMNKTRKVNKIPATRVDLHYLNYHEGWGGYRKGAYKNKKWLLKISDKVQKLADNYHQHLATSS